MANVARMRENRQATHLALGALTLAACGLSFWLLPRPYPALGFTVAFGYTALAYTAATLLVGPLALVRRRRNPVNLDLRRDLGIWAGITGGLHVLFGLQIYAGRQILSYFFAPGPGLTLLVNLFGLGNWLGAAATAILVGLLALSNNLTLRRLRGPRWKFWQRFNYALFALVVAHALVYHAFLQREPVTPVVTAVLAVLVLLAQGLGFVRYRRALSR